MFNSEHTTIRDTLIPREKIVSFVLDPITWKGFSTRLQTTLLCTKETRQTKTENEKRVIYKKSCTDNNRNIKYSSKVKIIVYITVIPNDVVIFQLYFVPKMKKQILLTGFLIYVYS